jgi:DNA invertase Pin-like site-specific DNA recombinase
MPTECIRKGIVNRGQWNEENLREAVRRLQANEISLREVERYYGISARTLKRRLESGNLNKGRLGPVGNLFSFSNNQVHHFLI